MHNLLFFDATCFREMVCPMLMVLGEGKGTYHPQTRKEFRPNMLHNMQMKQLICIFSALFWVLLVLMLYRMVMKLGGYNHYIETNFLTIFSRSSRVIQGTSEVKLIWSFVGTWYLVDMVTISSRIVYRYFQGNLRSLRGHLMSYFYKLLYELETW